MKTLSYPKEVKARKEHRCSFCNERITKDTIYMKSTHIYDGRVYDWKTHNHCNKLAHRLNMYDHHDEDGVGMDDFMEHVSCKHGDILIEQIPEKDRPKFGDIIRQFNLVIFRHKLWFVIRYFNQIDKEKEKRKETLTRDTQR